MQLRQEPIVLLRIRSNSTLNRKKIVTLSPTPVTLRVKQKGLTLLETVLALAVGVVIVMSVLIYFQTASNSANMAATIKITSDIGNAVRAYAQSPSYKPGKNINLADLQAMGLLTTADTVNPWSGALQVGTSGNYLGIKFFNVPAQKTTTSGVTTLSGSCALLASQLSRALPMPSPGTVTLFGATYTYKFSYASGESGVTVTITPKTGGGSSTTKTTNGAAACQYSGGTDTTGQLVVVMDLT
jgi:type II secretory pathway pseudopilin PulG